MPDEMSNEMLDENGLNLNALSYNSSAKLLKDVLRKGFKVKRILLDQLGPPSKHVFEMRKQCGNLLSPETEVISESKADDKYPVVSAASIVAKVTRDNLLENWVFVETKVGLK
jgi:ribonuclease H2 subunit A